MANIIIQGIDVIFRDLRPNENILYNDLPKEEQYFRREQHPFSDDELVDIANKEHQYSSFQAKWKETQESIFEDGIYASINGEITFIPGAYWCYINYWTLEHGEKPEYREDDRLFFLFHEYLRLNTGALGVVRLKGRRQGATSIAMFFMWFIGGRKEHALCGLTSFNDGAAQDAFQKMFMYGFKAMLPCFQSDFDSDSDNFIRFVKPVEKKKKGVLAVKREGLNSYCDYKSNVISSYDSGRQTYNVPDEGGKRNKLNINSYWSRLYKTLLIGTNKVGFAYLPTTVGSKTEGGENFKLFYKNANQFEVNKETGKIVGINTVNRVVRYFVPATHCYAGCIDKFGKSVVDDPPEPILSNEIDKETGRLKWIKEGSKTIILRERARQTGEQLMEHRRDYPLDEYDAFSFEAGHCEFNEEILRSRIKWLDENPVLLRQCRIIEEIKITKGIFPGQRDTKERIIKFMEDPTGNWLVYEMPQKEPNGKYFEVINDIYRVTNVHRYVVGADTIRIFDAENGSKATICVHKTSIGVGGEELGNYPVAFYVGRPKLPSQLYDEIIKVCLMYGCRANIERSAGDHFSEYFYKQGVDDLLLWTPARNPNAPMQKIGVGTETASPYQLAAQLECAKIYFDGTLIDGYNGNVHRIVFPQLLQQALEYNHSARTPFDLMVSFQMCLVAALKAPQIKVHQSRPKQLLPTYTIESAN